MVKQYSLSIWWIKRDFRLADNAALMAALRESEQVLPLYVFEPSIMNAPDYSDFHRHAVSTALRELQSRVEALGSAIWIQECEIETAIATISSLHPPEAVFSHEETGLNATFERDKRLKKWLESRNISWREVPTNGVVRRLADRSKRSAIWNQRMSSPVLCSPETIPLGEQLLSASHNAHCTHHNVLTQWRANPSLQEVSEAAAQSDLSSFLSERGQGYSGGISSPNTAFTSGSRLSAHLAWGCVSLRQLVSAKNARISELRGQKTEQARQWRKSLNAFSSRLHWHDHFIQRLESQPNMEFRALHPSFEALPYRYDADLMQRWLAGTTGVPMVDACMRCLGETGFLNFRMRAMIVSYACHVLHLSWKDIMHPLAQRFLDYEPGIHVSQLQMQAGVVGINTLRVYNPDKQMLDHDSSLTFVRRWVPELRSNSREAIFNYQNSRIPDYPQPLVDHKEASAVMKKAFYAIKRSPEAKAESERVLKEHGSRKRRGRRSRETVTRTTGRTDAAQLALFETESP